MKRTERRPISVHRGFIDVDHVTMLMDKIIAAGGGDGFRPVSAEEWVSYYRQAL